MKYIHSTLIAFLIVFSSLHAQTNNSEWKALFNGKNLKGWHQLNGQAKFLVEGDEIIGISQTGIPNSFLATKKEYTNFVLEFDVKMDVGLNSGVQFRSHSLESYNNGRVHGTQLECEDTQRGWAGGIYYEAMKGWRYPLDYNSAAKTAFKKGEWNRFKLVCFDHHILSWVNGVSCSNLLEEDIETGFIALQVHGIGNNKALDGKTIRWKNIRLKEASIADVSGNDAPEVSYLTNQLTNSEKAQDWKLLWDGATTNGWQSAKSDVFPKQGWLMQKGILSVEKSDGGESRNGGDIVTTKKYKNFILEVDFQLTPGANSGIKYFVDTDLNKGSGSSIGCEFQILDDNLHPDAKLGVNGNRTLGSLYDLIKANGKEYNPYLPHEKYVNGFSQWNRARIVVNDNHVEHYVNGSKVVEYERNTQMWRALVAYSKYSKWPNFGSNEYGNILLQDHGDKVSFKNIKIKEL